MEQPPPINCPDETHDGATLRAFVAVEVGELVTRAAAAIIERLRAGGAADVKWVESRHFHLTLKFLGETRRSDLPRLCEALRAVAERAAPFGLVLFGVGAFPTARRPEVVWLGVAAGGEALSELARATDAACAALGWAREERPYRAHLTLGRAQAPRRRRGPGEGSDAAASASRSALAQSLTAERETRAGATSVERILLVQSQLRPGGPVYTVLDSFFLGGTSPGTTDHLPR